MVLFLICKLLLPVPNLFQHSNCTGVDGEMLIPATLGQLEQILSYLVCSEWAMCIFNL